jgi:hypothetical protein
LHGHDLGNNNKVGVPVEQRKGFAAVPGISLIEQFMGHLWRPARPSSKQGVDRDGMAIA